VGFWGWGVGEYRGVGGGEGAEKSGGAWHRVREPCSGGGDRGDVAAAAQRLRRRREGAAASAAGAGAAEGGKNPLSCLSRGRARPTLLEAPGNAPPRGFSRPRARGREGHARAARAAFRARAETASGRESPSFLACGCAPRRPDLSARRAQSPSHPPNPPKRSGEGGRSDPARAPSAGGVSEGARAGGAARYGGRESLAFASPHQAPRRARAPPACGAWCLVCGVRACVYWWWS
jgi:hypothetical protein